ncbi:hypothetical protein [Vibrio splendidus]|uniref:hypothetical protein n=1 Tax=Vibrio splendidus TaxID=29497 RepID=UPI000D374B31|nr:hypothetical protein [Vibrio splendidus]PTO78186.1 hypothetical protein CWN93_19885 [Vibrio splendidus]
MKFNSTCYSKSEANIFSLYCFLLFIIFSVLFRVFLPFGDEPDFTVRAPRFVLEQPDFLSPYLTIINSGLDYITECQIETTLIIFMSSVDFDSCMQDSYQVSIRLFNQFILMVIPWLCLIFRSYIYAVINECREVVDRKLDALSISFLTSSFIYYYGVLGWEQLLLLLSAITFLLFNNRIMLVLLLAWIITIDLGDSVLVIYSIAIFYGYEFLAKKLGVKKIILVALLIVCISLILGTSLIGVFSHVGMLADKADAISSAYEHTELRDKYPIYLRPVITFLTLVLYLPSGVKAIFAILFVATCVCYIAMHVVNRYKTIDIHDFCYLATFVTVILSVVFILPGYANGKYYVFMLPMFYYFILSNFSKKNVLVFVSIANSLCILELGLAYLN